MKLTFIALADFVNEVQGGKLNVLGIFDTIGAKDFPTTHVQMSLVLRFSCDFADSEKERAIRVQFEAPNGATFLDFAAKIPIPTMQPGQSGMTNQTLNLVGVEFKDPGTYIVRVYVEDEIAGEIPLQLIKT